VIAGLFQPAGLEAVHAGILSEEEVPVLLSDPLVFEVLHGVKLQRGRMILDEVKRQACRVTGRAILILGRKAVGVLESGVAETQF
jgi:hypothetical protein